MTSRGEGRATRTRSSSPRSCSSRRRSPASCRATTPGWRAGRRSRPSRTRLPRTSSERGRGSVTTGGHSTCTEPRGRWPRTAGRKTSPSCPESAATPRMRSRALPTTLDVLPVDTNVRRVLDRTGGQFGPDAAHALMDLGATICLARIPRCETCPLAERCPSRGASTSRFANRAASKDRSGSAARGRSGSWRTRPVAWTSSTRKSCPHWLRTASSSYEPAPSRCRSNATA